MPNPANVNHSAFGMNFELSLPARQADLPSIGAERLGVPMLVCRRSQWRARCAERRGRCTMMSRFWRTGCFVAGLPMLLLGGCTSTQVLDIVEASLSLADAIA